MTKTAPIRKLEATLRKGTTMSIAQIRSRFKLADPTSSIAKLRKEGMKIMTNTHKGKTMYSFMGCKAA
jgi:hypothetical protein